MENAALTPYRKCRSSPKGGQSPHYFRTSSRDCAQYGPTWTTPNLPPLKLEVDIQGNIVRSQKCDQNQTEKKCVTQKKYQRNHKVTNAE